MELKHEKRHGEIHIMRGRSQSKNQEGGNKKNGRSRSKSKNQGKGKKCYGCGKTGHFIKDYYAEKNKNKEKSRDQEEANVVTSYDPSEVYMF